MAKSRFSRAWDDVRIEPVARTTGAHAPAFEKWFDDAGGTSIGVFLYSFDDATAPNEKEVFFTLQMPHTYAIGTDIEVHVHWVPNLDDATATPRWGLEYCWKEPGQVFGDTTIIYAVGNVQGDANLTAYKHYITEFAALTPDASQDNISTILIGRVFRNSSDAADTYNVANNKCGLLYIDAHFQVDSSGSLDEFSK